MLEYRLHDGHSLERPIKVEGGVAINHLCRTQDRLRELTHQLFCEIHGVTIICIGPVELQHGELRVMPGRESLIAEITIDLEHFLQTADGEALEIEFRGHPEIHLHIKRVVMRNKGPRRGTTGNGMQHWRLNLNKLPLNQKLPNTLNRRSTDTKDLARFGVHDKVNITLAVAHLLVDQTMILVG